LNEHLTTFTWLLLAIPTGAVAWGLVVFLLRWARLRRREAPDDQVLLGAVSQSLRERGELAASLGQLRTVHERLLDALPTGVLWVDQRGRVAALNAEGCRLLGVRPGVLSLRADFVLGPFPWLLEALARGPGPAVACEGNGRRWRVRRIEAPDRVGSLLQFEDITEAELAERRAQLRERFAELGEMTAGVAHQLKNGLAVFKGHAQLLSRAGHGPVAEALLRETEEMERLVQRFLQWARPLEPQCLDLDLEPVAAAALEEVGRRPCAQGRVLTRVGMGRALADPLLLQQALVNLLENACEATPAGGAVEIRVGDGSVEVLDGGPGLGEDTLARMLRPFESGRPDGTGLGLPLALKWLNAQGADLRITRRAEGGTRAEVRFA
jgi:two-component system, sensor histidine kinase FlrB